MTHHRPTTFTDDGETPVEEILAVVHNSAPFDDGTHHEPGFGTDPEPETIVWEAPDIFDTEPQQAWDAMPVSGAQVAIKPGRSFTFEVRLELQYGDAIVDSSRLVIANRHSTVIRWAERAMEAVADTPDGWTLTSTSAIEDIRWQSLESSPDALGVIQEDRDNLEKRVWALRHYPNPFESPKLVGDSSERVREGLGKEYAVGAAVAWLRTNATGSAAAQSGSASGSEAQS